MIDYSDIRERIEARKEFCASLVDAAIAQADARADMNAFIELFAEPARTRARECDARTAAGDARPLEGMLIAVKDNIAVRGHEITAGSRMLAGYRAMRDATVVARLRDAGAVLLGRTNMDEFAMGSSGQTSAHGPVCHPFLDGYVPGGSSSGSAAAVASGIVHGALGTDTGGSVRQPAAYTCTVGMKPTYGRVSRSGLVAFSSSCDQIGPITATVEDNARMLAVIAGRDPHDATTADVPVPDFTASAAAGVTGLRIGLPAEYLDDRVPENLRRRVRRVAERLEQEGAVVRDCTLPLTRAVFPAYFLIANAEASSNLARYDGVRLGAAADMDALHDRYVRSRSEGFGREVKRRIMLGNYVLSGGHEHDWYGRAQRVRRLVREEFDRSFNAFDLLLTPVTPGPPFRMGERLADPMDMYLTDVFNTAANLSGLPAISVPAGMDEQGLPFAVQLMSAAWREDLLYAAAGMVERLHHDDVADRRGGASPMGASRMGASCADASHGEKGTRA